MHSFACTTPCWRAPTSTDSTWGWREGFGFGDEGVLFDPTGVPDERIAVRVDTRPVRDRKLAGIERHRTQRIEFERIPQPLRWIYLDAECFVQAFPPIEGQPSVRSDLLDDLPRDLRDRISR